jgi:serine/threonine-protein kinase
LTDKVKEIAAADHDIAYWLASAYVLLGEEDEALKWLETAIELGNENYLWFQSDSNWSALHNDPRFKALMQRLEVERQEREGQTA